MTGPILYPGRLPEGALVPSGTAPAQPGHVAVPPAPIWFDCTSGLPDRGPVTEWRAAAGEAAALAVRKNEHGTPRARSGALRFTARENGGLAVAGALPDLATASVAAILVPDRKKPAETVLTLQPADGTGYVFVAHDGTRVRVGRKDGDLDLAAACPDGRLLAVLGLSGGRVRLSVNGSPAVEGSLALSGGADLFIGCRGARGLKNKLGTFQLSDVMVWPGTDVLSGGGLGDALALLAKRSAHAV